MYNQQAPLPRDERGYRSESTYEIGSSDSQLHSDQLADAIARRLQAQTPSQTQMPIGLQWVKTPFLATAGQRLALAVISVLAMIPLTAIILAALNAAGLIALCVVGAVILGINITYNKGNQ